MRTGSARTTRPSFRRLPAVAPFAVLATLASHRLHFGDDHAFGGDAHEAIVTLGLAGLGFVLAVLLWRGAAAAVGGADGSLVARRLASVFPADGAVWGVAASVSSLGLLLYAGGEALEGNFALPALVVPALTIAALALAQALALRVLVGFVAGARFGRERPALVEARRAGTARAPVSAPMLPAIASLFARARGLRAPPVAS